MKFKDRQGPYATLPKWIAVFEREVKVDFENLRDLMKEMEHKLEVKQRKVVHDLFAEVTE